MILQRAEAIIFPLDFGHRAAVSPPSVFPCFPLAGHLSSEAKDLIVQMLVVDPTRRNLMVRRQVGEVGNNFLHRHVASFFLGYDRLIDSFQK